MNGTTFALPAPFAERLAGARAALAEAGPPVAAGLLVVLVGAKSGGYWPTTWGWQGLALAWIAALGLLLSSTRLGRLDLATVGALTAYVGWVAISRIWSNAPGHTITEVQRDLIYPLALLSALLLVRTTAVATLLWSVAAGIDLVVVYGLLTRLFPDQLGAFDSIAAYRLSAPVGYWNTLGILASMGMVLTFGFAARGRLVTRALAAAALVGLCPTLYFTFSRGAVIALGIGLLALLVIDPRRLQLTVAALVVLPLPVAATFVASQYGALTTNAASLAAAAHDGHRLFTFLAGLALLNAVLALALGFAQERVAFGSWIRRGYATVLAVAAIGVIVAIVAHFGGPNRMAQRAYDSFRGPPIGSTNAGVNLGKRFLSLSSNGRITLWEAAWNDFRRRPVVGSGAGGFEWYWAKHQPVPAKARDAHSLYMETLAELGVVGLALIVLALVLPFGAVVRARRHPMLPFAVGAYVAFAAHVGVDWDWEMPVVILCGLFCAAAILLAGRGETTVALPEGIRYGAVAVIAVAAVLAFVGIIGNGALASAQTARSEGNLAAAERDARRATTWLPWSAEPYKALGYIQQARGELAGARASFREAVKLEPLDYDAWLGLGSVLEGPASRRAWAKAERLYPFNPVNVGLKPTRR